MSDHQRPDAPLVCGSLSLHAVRVRVLVFRSTYAGTHPWQRRTRSCVRMAEAGLATPASRSCARPCTRFVRAAPSCRLLGYSIPQPLGPHGADLFRLAERVVQSDSRRPTGARHGERCRSERRGSAARCCAAHLSVALRAELWLELRLLLAAHAADVLGAYYQGGWEQAGRCQGGRGGGAGLSLQHTHLAGRSLRSLAPPAELCAALMLPVCLVSASTDP